MELLLEDRNRHDDRSKDVVQVVGKAACERADAFQTLGSQNLLFEFLLLCDVRRDDKNGVVVSIFVAHKAPAALDDHLFEVFRELAQLTKP